MSVLPSQIPLRLSLVLLPVVSLIFVPVPLEAGNQNGPGWQGQAKPKKGPRRAPKPRSPEPAAPVTGGKSGTGQPLPAAIQGRMVPTEEMVRSLIPETGPLSEDALIRMAIATDPTLARRRGEVLISQARQRGAGDWENPELRIGYTWDYDDRLQEPFVESSTERIRLSERYSSTQRSRNLAPEFNPGSGDSQIQRTRGTERSTRYSTVERKVTPGRFQDVIDTTIYERRNATGSSNRTATNTLGFGQGSSTTNEARSERLERRIVERSREIVNHPDDYSRDDQLSILIRFRLPHLWERRAKIEIAAAETARAESDYLIEEDKLILTVRALYEELTTMENLSRSNVTRRTMHDKFREEVEAANLPDLADLAADMRLQVGKAIRDQREYRSDIARVREELAIVCGLDVSERIVTPSNPVRRVVSTADLDVDYLTTIAQLHRSDLLDLQARLAVAKAELMGAKAARIPFFTFIDVGWAASTTTGRTGENEEWGVRAGITLPFFEWTGINKAHLEFETATGTYSRQVEDQRRLIGNEIRQAIKRIRAAADELSTYETDFARIRQDSKRSLEETAIEPIKSLKTRYQTEDLMAKFEEDRFEVWSDYHKAVLELERTLGTRLERVLSSR